MNCKPGDLAVIVRSLARNEGVILTCVRVATPAEVERARLLPGLEPAWIVDRQLKASHGLIVSVVPDSYLRPIRDNDGTDETLTWAPKREGVEA